MTGSVRHVTRINKSAQDNSTIHIELTCWLFFAYSLSISSCVTRNFAFKKRIVASDVYTHMHTPSGDRLHIEEGYKQLTCSHLLCSLWQYVTDIESNTGC